MRAASVANAANPVNAAVIATVLVGSVAVGTTARAGGPDVSNQEYQLYMDWKDGREDPRLEKLDEAGKLKKIAASLGVTAKELQAAIAKVQPVADTLAKDTERALRAALDTTPLKGRVLEVHVDAGQAHVVAGIKWRCGDARDADAEAAYAGWAVGDSGKLVKTVVVWCVNEGDTKLFSAKAAGAAMARISKTSIERFASSRYIKLFEEVKRGPHR